MSRTVRLGNRRITLPSSAGVRIALGVLLVCGGLLGFLPILGFWMIPLGLIVLSVDLPLVRRLRRRMEVPILRWWYGVRGNGKGNGG
jgi:hypothetical protein